MTVRVFDLHCDTPLNISRQRFRQVQPVKLRAQGYLAVVFAHWVKPVSAAPFVEAVRLISSTIQFLSYLPDCRIINQPADFDPTRLNILLGVEGGHIFDRDRNQLEVLYHLGVRVFTLLWNNSNRLGRSALDDDRRGLTARGRSFIRDIESYWLFLDLSHASTRTVLDVCDLRTHRVFASHSCIRALNPNFLRNLSDEAARAIASRRGLVGVNFSRKHLGQYQVTDHIDYLKDFCGISTIGIGSDFDGIDDPVIDGPAGTVSLAEQLCRRGYSNQEIADIFAGNALNFFFPEARASKILA